MTQYSSFTGYAHLAAGLACGLSGMAAGIAIGIVGDAGVMRVSVPEATCVPSAEEEEEEETVIARGKELT